MLKRNIFKEESTESQARREVLTVRSSSDHASKAVANCVLTNPEVVEHMRDQFCYKTIASTSPLTWSDDADMERMTWHGIVYSLKTKVYRTRHGIHTRVLKAG